MENPILLLWGFFFISAIISQITLFFLRWWRKKKIPSSDNLKEVPIATTTTITTTITTTTITTETERCDYVEHTIDVLSIAFLWYSISLSFTLFNKWFMQEWQGGFHFPMFITYIHMMMKLLISRLWSISPAVEKIEPITWHVFFTVVFPIGAMTAGDVVLSNSAILFLPLSLVTAIKGSSLIFTFLWGVLLQIEEFRWSLLVSIGGITAGLALAVSNSLDVQLAGLLCAFFAAAVSGLRWALMQLLAVKDDQSKSVMITLYRFAPASVFSILPFVMTLEGHRLSLSSFAHQPKQFYDASLLCAFGGVIAFLLIVVEVKLLRLTSSLTMSVFGQVKEMIQIILAMMVFKENLSYKTGWGVSISIFCSLYYRYIMSSNVVSPRPRIGKGMGDSKGSEEQLNLLDEECMETEMVALALANKDRALRSDSTSIPMIDGGKDGCDTWRERL